MFKDKFLFFNRSQYYSYGVFLVCIMVDQIFKIIYSNKRGVKNRAGGCTVHNKFPPSDSIGSRSPNGMRLVGGQWRSDRAVWWVTVVIASSSTPRMHTSQSNGVRQRWLRHRSRCSTCKTHAVFIRRRSHPKFAFWSFRTAIHRFSVWRLLR